MRIPSLRLATPFVGIMATRPMVESPLSPSSAKSVQYKDHGNEESHLTESSPGRPYTVYKWRWFMLVALCVLNVSNGMMWLTFSPIPNFTASYYNVSLSSVDWFSISFFAVSLAIGLVSIYIMSRYGLKVTVYTGAILNFCGALLRVVSTIKPIICSSVPGLGYGVAMIGQVLCAAGQPFILYAPTTLASLWFGPKERAVATGLTSLSNPVGLAVVQVASPYIVTSISKVPMMLWIYAVPALVALVISLISFWYKRPQTPPTSSAERDDTPSFFRGIRMTFSIPSFWLLLIVWGSASGLFNSFLTLLPQILCPYGYTNKQSGLWGSLMIFSGMIGAVVGGLLIDYFKLFKDVAVGAYSAAIFAFIWFYEVFNDSGQAVVIAFSLCVFGFFGLSLLPVFMELGVEVTYPVSEVTSSGLLWTATQIMGIVIVLCGQVLQVPLSPPLILTSVCGSGAVLSHDSSTTSVCANPQLNASIPAVLTPDAKGYDLTRTLYLCITLITVSYLVLVLCFWPRYKRVELEKRTQPSARPSSYS